MTDTESPITTGSFCSFVLYTFAEIRHCVGGFPGSMADKMTKKTQAEATLNDPGKYRLAPGLYLQVTGPTAKSWIYRYTVRGQERFMGLGSARDVTLAQARKRVDELRVTQVSKKIDPIAERKQIEANAKAAKAKAVPFRERADQYITAHQGEWRTPKHRAQWSATLQTYAYPVIGELSASAINVSHIVEGAPAHLGREGKTARRVRGRIEAVLDYAADPDDATYRNPAAMTAQLAKKLPKPAKSKAPVDHPSLPYDEIGPFMTLLRAAQARLPERWNSQS